ncbi:MAG: HD domain-containing protein [Candidatus Uhrbacteria bacterium]|nr:HD domain-containing protein [Candidatus Uhrbacteria bacterium]
MSTTDPVYPGLSKAILFAIRAYGSVKRLDGSTYLGHALRVALIIAEELGNASEDALILALLHDSMEESNTTFMDISREFGPIMASYVAILSKDQVTPEEAIGQDLLHIPSLKGMALPVRQVRLADRLDNMRSVSDLPDEHRSQIVTYLRRSLPVVLELAQHTNPWFVEAISSTSLE